MGKSGSERDAVIQLEKAWKWRHDSGYFAATDALRVFHGPGEGEGWLSQVALDRFGAHYWITVWESERLRAGAEASSMVLRFLREFSPAEAASAVLLFRPLRGVPEDPKIVFGKPPEGRFEVGEGKARFLIQLVNAKHPGLFLDHRPLREWLTGHCRGLKVLNTFAYTGSLSVAAGLGEASEVVTLDLSKPSIAWAEQNWRINGLAPKKGRFIAGDYFEWLPRLKREGKKFDCVVLDPPSFSRGEKGTFSTAKDLKRLHLLAMDVLEEGGYLVTSINSANITWDKYEAEISSAGRERGMHLNVLRQIDLPETFPTPMERPEERYLKGWILKRR